MKDALLIPDVLIRENNHYAGSYIQSGVLLRACGFNVKNCRFFLITF